MWGDTINIHKLQRPPSNTYVTASLLNNALTTYDKLAAYPHVKDVVLIKSIDELATDAKKACSVLECGALVLQCKLLLSTDNALVLVVCTADGVQVWEPNEEKRLASITVPFTSGGPGDLQDFTRGATIVGGADGSRKLIVGGASGTLHAFEVDKYRFVYNGPIQGFTHTSPIADVSSTHEPNYAEHTLPALCHFAAVDEAGVVSIWDATTLTPIADITTPGECFTSVSMRGGLVMAGTLLGKICIFNVEEKRMQAEICAHARAISALALHPATMLIASASEDSYVNVWNLESIDKKEIEAMSSTSVKDKLLCGVRFYGEGGKDIALCSYDLEALIRLPGEAIVG